MDMGFAQKMQRCHEYVQALEEEKRKIQVFQRELPLCLELVTQAIEACKKELSGTTAAAEYIQGQPECSEQTSSDTPVLEEFMPLKRTSSEEDNDEEHSHKPSTTTTSDKKKSDWLRSVQLWNQSPDPPPKEDLPRKTAVVEVKRNGGAFLPFHREKSVGKPDHQSVAKPNSAAVPAAATSSTTETVSKGSAGNSSKREEDKEGQSTQRKQRRCWSPELHRRFLHALQQLGGSHGATPKQIRELMKVDGLTNDEVKSHLQKYRLHTRRPSPTIHNNASPQAPQFVVVGGIWVPPPEYASMTAKSSGEAASIAGANGIYAPMAAPQSAAAALVQRSRQAQSENLQSEEGGNHSHSHSEGGLHSSSPATSSSTHTTTTSPPL